MTQSRSGVIFGRHEEEPRVQVALRRTTHCSDDGQTATTHHSFRQVETARSRLYRRRIWPPNSHFAAFFKIYKIFTILRRSNLKMLQNFVKKFVILKKISQNLNFAKYNLNIQKKIEKFDKLLEDLDIFL